jgi:hypothetical protein
MFKNIDLKYLRATENHNQLSYEYFYLHKENNGIINNWVYNVLVA